MTGTILKWGNSYGIRISKADLERLGLHEKQRVDIDDIKPAESPLLELWGSGKDNPITREEFKRWRESMPESKWLDK